MSESYIFLYEGYALIQFGQGGYQVSLPISRHRQGVHLASNLFQLREVRKFVTDALRNIDQLGLKEKATVNTKYELNNIDATFNVS